MDNSKWAYFFVSLISLFEVICAMVLFKKEKKTLTSVLNQNDYCGIASTKVCSLILHVNMYLSAPN